MSLIRDLASLVAITLSLAIITLAACIILGA